MYEKYVNYTLKIHENVFKLCNTVHALKMCIWQNDNKKLVNIFCLADRKKKEGTPYFTGRNSDL
jgi:hypothetical protein